MKLSFLFLLILVILTTNLSYAQWSSNSTINTVVCNDANSQDTPQIISDGSSGAIIVWRDSRNGTNDIYAQKLNSSGVAQWTANGVAICIAASNQTEPQLVSDGSGGAIITWDDQRDGTSDVYAQRINSSGVVQWTVDGVVIASAASNQNSPFLISDGSGGAIITWFDFRSTTNNDIYAQRINASGVVQWTANGVVICNAPLNQYDPRPVSDGSGGAVIVWSDQRTENDLYAQRINSSGAVQWTANGVVISTATNTQYRSEIVSDGSSGAVIAWLDYRTGTADIYAQNINSSGVVQWTADGVAICTASNAQEDVKLLGDGVGGAIIVWDDARSTTHIYGQRVNSSGVVQWTSNGIAICSASGGQYYPRLISDGSTGAIVVWQDIRNGNWDAYAQKINSSGADQWTNNGVAISTASGQQYAPKPISYGSNGAIFAWEDSRANSEIYAQNVNSDGTIGPSTPTITTTSATSITNSTASSGGNVTSDGGASVTARGVIYGTSSSPELSASSTTTSNGSGTGSFASSLTSLSLQTLYYVKAYATNSVGTSYGSQVSFTTIPTLPEWGLIAMGLMIASFGGMYVWKRVV